MNMKQTLFGLILGLVVAVSHGRPAPDCEYVTGWDAASGTITAIADEIVLNPLEVHHLHQLAQLPTQLRSRIYVSPVLCAAARIKAMDGGVNHYDSEGKTIFERMGLGGVELLGGSVANLASEIGTTHDEAMRGEGRYGTMLYVGVSDVVGGGVVFLFSTERYTYFKGKTIKVYMPEGTPIPIDWNLMEWGKIGARASLLALRQDGGKLVSPWLGSFVEVGGNFILSDQMGLVRVDPLSGWYGNVPYGWETERPYDDYGLFNSVMGDIWNRKSDGWWSGSGVWVAEYDYTSPRIPFLWNDTRRTMFGNYQEYQEYAHFDGVSSYKQGYWLVVPDLGPVWTHPMAYPNAWVQGENRWVRMNTIKPQGAFVQLESDVRQVYQGESVIFAWNASGNARFECQGQAFNQPVGAVAITATGGEIVAVVQSGAVSAEKRVAVLPRPHNPSVWIDAAPKVVQVGEPFLVAWNSSGGIPMVSAESHGLFSNEASGGIHFARQIPGDYTFTVRLGEAIQHVTVRVEGAMHRSEYGTTTWIMRQK